MSDVSQYFQHHSQIANSVWGFHFAADILDDPDIYIIPTEEVKILNRISTGSAGIVFKYIFTARGPFDISSYVWGAFAERYGLRATEEIE